MFPGKFGGTWAVPKKVLLIYEIKNTNKTLTKHKIVQNTNSHSAALNSIFGGLSWVIILSW